jgi:DNA-binding GntR family transcriptional regulator
MTDTNTDNSVRSLKRQTLATSVYEILRDDIINTKISPGSVIYEAALAREMGISRGPVREALQKLAAEGFIDLSPHKRAVVSSLTVQGFVDAYRVREALEVLGVKLAATNIDKDNLEILKDLLIEMEKCSQIEDVSGFFAANEKFHKIIIVQSKNSKLIELYSSLVDQLRRYRMKSLTLRGGFLQSCKEHQELVNALISHDAELASKLMKEHIQIPRNALKTEYDENELEIIKW